jgi:probable rRNA maturation factor
MAVTVRCLVRHPGLRSAAVRADARRILAALGEGGADLVVSLVDDPYTHRLNRTYRGVDRPTDVLAFAMREGPRVPGDRATLGDVVISVDSAARQARGRAVSIAEETRALLIHGVLHLLGYDHERSAAEARRMRAKERTVHTALEAASGAARLRSPGARLERSGRWKKRP